VRFLGVDLAWKDGNPSGVALLGGEGFPLRLEEIPHTLSSHRAVLEWMAHHVATHPAAVGIDAPLLGLDTVGHRVAEREIAARFQRYDAPAYPPPKDPDLRSFVGSLHRYWPSEACGPAHVPTSGKPAIREVYPNALQVGLFRLDEIANSKILKYKRKKKRFTGKADWAERGLKPFISRCSQAVFDRDLITNDSTWEVFVEDAPNASKTAAQLKSVEDRWDALLCALAVALEFLEQGSMRFYPDGAEAWRSGYILAPALPCPS
jgi:predicted RNase H-like nuclease